MPRVVLALLAVLILAALAVSAHAAGHAGHGRSVVDRSAASVPPAVTVAKSVASRPPEAPRRDTAVSAADFPRDCGLGSTMNDCACMVSCIAVTLPDLPIIDRAAPSVRQPPAVGSPLQATVLVPPTPPPRA